MGYVDYVDAGAIAELRRLHAAQVQCRGEPAKVSHASVA